LFKVALANDVQSYSLGTNNLYQYSLSLEEVQ
jgi:phosphoenolpyruvate-protein kinase (PTS system EI component)